MRKPLLILVSVGCFLLICACNKSNKGSDSQGIVGTWTVLGVSGQSKVVDTLGVGVTMIAYPAFVTKNNTGSFTFSKDSLQGSGVGYSVDTAFWGYFYYGSSLYDSARQTLNYTVPPTSSTSKYNQIGTDSIFFPHGGILAVLDSSSAGEGCSYVLKGDSLTLTARGVNMSNGAQTTYSAVILLKRSK